MCMWFSPQIFKAPRTPVSHYESQHETNQQSCKFEKKIWKQHKCGHWQGNITECEAELSVNVIERWKNNIVWGIEFWDFWLKKSTAEWQKVSETVDCVRSELCTLNKIKTPLWLQSAWKTHRHAWSQAGKGEGTLSSRAKHCLWHCAWKKVTQRPDWNCASDFMPNWIHTQIK